MLDAIKAQWYISKSYVRRGISTSLINNAAATIRTTGLMKKDSTGEALIKSNGT
jgi:hypothetical protein